MVDLLAMPSQFRPHNISSKGAGCCTFRSAEYAARWQNVPALFGLPEWMKSQGIAGGGTPGKQAAMVEKISKARNLPTPRFVQYEGNDLSFIELVLKTGRVACITWGGNHMLNCVHLDATQAAIVDNNAPDKVQWFPREAFKKKHTAGGGGWVFALLSPGPPPAPSNVRPPAQGPPCGKASCKCGCQDGEPCRCAVAGKKCPCSGQCTCGCNEGGKCPCCPEEEDGAGGDGGLEWEYGGRERFLIGSVEATQAEVEEALEDDSNKLHLTVVAGTDAERKAVLDSIGAEAGRYLVQGYAADDWAVQCGFAPGAAATVYLQGRDGKVLLRSGAAAEAR